ncbi:Mitochondrial ribosomal subunit S27 [Mactra antiquata]
MPSQYAIRMARLSNRIFGEVVRPTDQKSMKVVKIFSGIPAHLDPYKVNYYPRHRELKTLMSGLRDHGLFRDEHADFKEEMINRKRARGKAGRVPPDVARRQAKEKAS